MTPESLVFIALGSNIDPERHLQAAVKRLHEHGEIVVVSSVYRSQASGFTEQPDYLNAVIALETTLVPIALKKALGIIEKDLGRDRASQLTKFGPLTLDLDIVLWDSESFTYGKKPWRVPHSDTTQKGFVAIPLAEIAPDLIHPDEGVTLAEIAARFSESPDILKTAFRLQLR